MRGHGDDVGGVAAARPLGVVGVDSPTGDGTKGVLHEAGLIEGVGVMATCTPASSATARQASMAPGVVPQSSWSLKPDAPARSCSHSPSAETVLPLPNRATLIGHGSRASSMRPRYQDPGVTVVALDPSAGPVPPPMMVVMPDPRASVMSWGQMRCTWQSTAPAA
jgi:hypothetical protein